MDDLVAGVIANLGCRLLLAVGGGWCPATG
jgi:hypothetical protein